MLTHTKNEKRIDPTDFQLPTSKFSGKKEKGHFAQKKKNLTSVPTVTWKASGKGGRGTLCAKKE